MHMHHTDEGAASTQAAPDSEDPLAAARRLLADNERARIESCAAEIAAVLEKHGMRLETAPAHIVLVPARPGEASA